MRNASEVLYNRDQVTYETVSDNTDRIPCERDKNTDKIFFCANSNNIDFFKNFIENYKQHGRKYLMGLFKRKNEKGDNLLHIAARQGNIGILTTILDGLASLDPVKDTASIELLTNEILSIKNTDRGDGLYFIDLLIENGHIDALQSLLNDSVSKGFYIEERILIPSNDYAQNCLRNNENIQCSRRGLEIIKAYIDQREIYSEGLKYLGGATDLDAFKNFDLSLLDSRLNQNSIENPIQNLPNVSNHARVHAIDKLYPCNRCGKSFRRKATLEMHLRTHIGERP